MRIPTLLLACSLALTGCVSVDTTRLGPPNVGYDRPRVAPDHVAVYRTADQVPGEYVEVALVHAAGSLAWSTESGMYQKMREEAGRLGANAIILAPMPEATIPQKIVMQELNVDIGREGRALAIYVLGQKRDDSAVRPGGGDSPEEAPAAVDASYVIRLESGPVVPAEIIEPSGVDQFKVTQPDGAVRYLSANRIRTVTDREGGDWTSRVLEERRRLPALK